MLLGDIRELGLKATTDTETLQMKSRQAERKRNRREKAKESMEGDRK